MDALVEWLTAQYDADEAYARNAFGEHNDAGPEWREVWSGGLEVGGDVINTNDSQVSRFMEQFDPAAVLADIASKREILKEHRAEEGPCRICMTEDREVLWDGEQETVEWVRRPVAAPCRTVRLLGVAYAARNGYREEWRPGPFG